MAEAEARREARRRKILENSEKRLNKISGVEQKSTKTELDGIRGNVSYTDDNQTSLIDRSNDSTDNEVLNLDRITSTSELENLTLQNATSGDNALSYSCQDANVNCRIRNFQIFLIPILLSLILIIFDMFQIDIRSIHLNKIFVPLLIYEIVEYFALPKADPAPNLLTSLLLLSNIKNRFITSYLGYLHYFFKVMQDLMVYFFVFTLSHGFLSFMLL